MEKDYPYETLAAVRQVAINKYQLEYRKNLERESMHRKIKQFEDSKAEGMFSGYFGGKSEEEKTK